MKRKRKNPLSKLWCNLQISDEEWESLDKKYLSNRALKAAYQGNGCWDVEKVIIAYVATINETGRLGKFPNISSNFSKKLNILEAFVMNEYINMEYTGHSDYMDYKYFEFLKAHHAKKRI